MPPIEQRGQSFFASFRSAFGGGEQRMGAGVWCEEYPKGIKSISPRLARRAEAGRRRKRDYLGYWSQKNNQPQRGLHPISRTTTQPFPGRNIWGTVCHVRENWFVIPGASGRLALNCATRQAA